jgi:hypothetical protein
MTVKVQKFYNHCYAKNEVVFLSFLQETNSRRTRTGKTGGYKVLFILEQHATGSRRISATTPSLNGSTDVPIKPQQ